MGINEKDILSGKICPYCGRPTELVDSSVVYGKSYGMIYLCKPCDAYVGLNKMTGKSLGRLANKELREAKIQAHYWFDQIARTGLINKIYRKFIPNTPSRQKAYIWLSMKLNIPVDKCHIGMMDVDDCKRVTELCKPIIEKLNGK